MKTILYIGGFELPDKNAAAHRVLNNAKILRDLGFRVVFIDVDKNLPYDSFVTQTKKKVQGFDCWSIPYPKSTKQWIHYLSDIYKFTNVFSMYEGVESVICYNYPAWALKKLRVFCKERNVKVISDCTEWYDARGSSIPFYVIKSIDSFFRMRVLQPKLDGLVVISKYLEKYYKNNNVVRIPPLVDLDEGKWEPVNLDDSSTLKLIYAGNPGNQKDKISSIVESLSKLNEKNFIFKVVGITQEDYLQNHPHHFDLVQSLGNKIRFLGRLSHDAALDHIKKSDFSLFIRDTNRQNMAGFPTKFVESISCGTPVITNPTSDLTEFLKDGLNGYWISVEDEKTTTKHLKKILETPREQVEKMKRACMGFKGFDYRTYMNEMSNFINNL